MQFSEISPVVFCVVSPFALGWLLFSMAVGMRGDWEAGLRLLLLGCGLLGTFFATVLLLVYLPDWAAIILLSLAALLPWVSMGRYFVASRLSGKMLMELSQKRKKWSPAPWIGALMVLVGLQNLFLPNSRLSLEKSYALGFLFVSAGFFKVTDRLRYTQVREQGILDESGSYYEWKNIDGYGWKFGEDKLSLHLRKSIFKKHVRVKIPSQFRHEAVALFSQHLDNAASATPEYVPIQKTG